MTSRVFLALGLVERIVAPRKTLTKKRGARYQDVCWSETFFRRGYAMVSRFLQKKAFQDKKIPRFCVWIEKCSYFSVFQSMTRDIPKDLLWTRNGMTFMTNFLNDTFFQYLKKKVFDSETVKLNNTFYSK